MLTATMPFDDRDVPSFLSCVEKGVYPEPPEVSESEFCPSSLLLAFSHLLQKPPPERMFFVVLARANGV